MSQETVINGQRMQTDAAERMRDLTQNYSSLMMEPAMLAFRFQTAFRRADIDVAIDEVLRDMRGLMEETIDHMRDYLIGNCDRAEEITDAHYQRANGKGGGWE